MHARGVAGGSRGLRWWCGGGARGVGGVGGAPPAAVGGEIIAPPCRRARTHRKAQSDPVDSASATGNGPVKVNQE
eukprot:9884874-Prorocentrum_lima.AAC.1